MEYVCLFHGAFVQNVQQDELKWLHTFVFSTFPLEAVEIITSVQGEIKIVRIMNTGKEKYVVPSIEKIEYGTLLVIAASTLEDMVDGEDWEW